MNDHKSDTIIAIIAIAFIIWGFCQAIPEKITVENNELIKYAKSKYSTDDAEEALARLYENLSENEKIFDSTQTKNLNTGDWTKQYYINLYNTELYGNGLCKYGYADVNFSDNIIKGYQIYLDDDIIEVKDDDMISLIFLDDIDNMSKFQFETSDCDSIYEIQFIKEKN